MPAPAQKACYVADCEYTTTLGIPSYELLMKGLEMHIRCVHTEVSQGNTIGQLGPKPVRLPRPTIGEGVLQRLTGTISVINGADTRDPH